MNRSEIWSNMKRKMLVLKWVGSTTRQLPPPPPPKKKRAPGWQGTVWCPSTIILHFKFQFSKSMKSSTFHIFLNLTYPLGKKYLFPKMPKNHPKIYTKPPNSGYGFEHRDLALLETWPRYRQKSRVKRRQNSFHVYPRLNRIHICFYVLFWNTAVSRRSSAFSGRQNNCSAHLWQIKF